VSSLESSYPPPTNSPTWGLVSVGSVLWLVGFVEYTLCAACWMSSGNRFPENYQTLTPILKVPLTDTFNLPLSQQGKPCGFFEAQFFRCLEAYGAKLGRKYCDLEHRDYQECLTSDKQRMRTRAIRNERRKKFLKGELPAAFLADHPQPGEYKADYFSNNRVH
uniref:NADH dehydrogenase [ubiquinone] iron-sulfur protein 5 n=1 Tax=Parascaris univalens TaxID=6257 RepID=A0A915BPU1_PARUN